MDRSITKLLLFMMLATAFFAFSDPAPCCAQGKEPVKEAEKDKEKDKKATPHPSERVKKKPAKEEAPIPSEGQKKPPQTAKVEATKKDEPTTKVAAGPSKPIKAEATESTTKPLKPRFSLLIPSLGLLIEKAGASHSSELMAPLGGMLAEAGQASAEGLDVEGLYTILKLLADWPATSLYAVTYSPDLEGKARWAIRFDGSLKELHARVDRLLKSDLGSSIFSGMKMSRNPEGGYVIRLAGAAICFLRATQDSGACITSHADLPLPAKPTLKKSTEGDQKPELIYSRINLAGTEEDSGATLFSGFSLVTQVDYSAHVDDNSDWQETVMVHWPLISGMGAKVLLGKVKQTFFVPREAFGAAAYNVVVAQEMLDTLAGFDPMILQDDSGSAAGPLSGHTSSDLCTILLPGTGFLPVPDIVFQSKLTDAEDWADDVREAIEKINGHLEERDETPPWHEATVRDRTVFWHDGSTTLQGATMPVVLKSVIFTTNEYDAREREREFLVVGLTSTTPEDLVARWLDLPRGREGIYIPQAKKTSGQIWFNWKQIYRWLSPYVNLSLSTVIQDTLLPGIEEIAPELSDGILTAKTSYSGFKVTYQGPLPTGIFVIPGMLSLTMASDGGGSDLARERLARQRLKILFHHCKLFHKDMGRWPAEVAELQGYIDFDGNPELLELERSSKRQIAEFFEGLFEDEEESEEAEEVVELVIFEQSPYVIEWGEKTWSMGYAPATFEHLEKLWIDQDGKIHRKRRVKKDKSLEKVENK
jgi:hypothetical protein